MRLRGEPAELTLAAAARAEVDAVAAFVGPERPLRGLAGLLDWRLCGALSRAVEDGTFAPDRGEALLLPGAGRLGAARVVCFGLRDASPEAAREGAARAAGILARAGCRAGAVELPPAAGGEGLRAWLEASLRLGLSPQVALGDPRALAREIAAAAAGLAGEVAIGPPARPGGGDARLPDRSPVVR
jgi:hypothetical protein